MKNSTNTRMFGKMAQVENKDLRWVSIDDIRKSLPQNPIRVGFDLDDTLVFSSSLYNYLSRKYRPVASLKYGYTQEFWDELNFDLDGKFSLPKEGAKKLIQMHQVRGDDIYFITSRMPSANENVSQTINQMFRIDNPHPMTFAGGIVHDSKFEKTPHLLNLKIDLFYGDGDDDVQAAMECNIRVVRFLRASNSTILPMPDAGAFGEEILIDSEF